MLVSGISRHRMVDANDRGLSIIDPGHAATERPDMARRHTLVEDVVGHEVDHVMSGPE